MANSANERTYFYTVSMLEVEDGHGNPLSPQETAMAFFSKPSETHSQFFNLGYNLDYDSSLFVDDGDANLVLTFPTTDGTVSYEDDIPNRVRTLMKAYPLLRVYPEAIFRQLMVQRNLLNVPVTGGKRKSRRGSRKSQRGSRKSRKTNRRA